MKANVEHFRDGKDTVSGETITVYIIKVEPSDAIAYTIAKRYSDFAQIYATFKDALPPDFKFPNKSLFHNNSQFTKERRLRGFQELLYLLLKYHPTNEKVKEFIRATPQLPSSDRNSSSGVNGSGGEGQSSRVSETKSSHSVHTNSAEVEKNEKVAATRLRRQLTALTSYITMQQEEYCSSSSNAFSSALAVDRKDETIRSFKWSMAVSSAVYSMLIAINMVDISETSMARMILTCVSLGMLLTFVNLIDQEKSVS
eukprot:gene8380-9238_t